MAGIRISQLAQRSGVPASTLRYYESVGLLSAQRTPGGYRMYDGAAVDRLAFISAAKRVGLPLTEIGELLQVWDGGACADVRRRLRPMMATRLDEVTTRTTDLQLFADSLRTALAHLDALPDRTSPCDAACTFLLTPGGPSVGTQRGGHGRDSAENVHATAPAPDYCCTATAAQYRDRSQQWRTLLSAATSHDITASRIGLRLPAQYGSQVAKLAAAEQQCCPFLSITMAFRAGQLDVEVQVPPEAAAVLADLFGVEHGSPSVVPTVAPSPRASDNAALPGGIQRQGGPATDLPTHCLVRGIAAPMSVIDVMERRQIPIYLGGLAPPAWPGRPAARCGSCASTPSWGHCCMPRSCKSRSPKSLAHSRIRGS